MSTMANVTLTDSVPANHVFAPARSEPVSVWEDSATPITALGTASITGSVKKALKSNEVNKVILRLAVPKEVTSTDTGVTTVSGILRVNTDFLSPADSTSTERLNVLTMYRDLIDEAIVTEMAQTLVQPS